MLDAWQQLCHERHAAPECCTGPEAVFLLTALAPALGRGTASSALARAGRTWGATCPSPTEAVASLACLREALGPADAAWQPVLDQLALEAVEGASASMRAAARTDPLTGCANRLALDEELGRAARAAARSGLDVAVAVIDLDGLKQVNDTDGHAAGDARLRSLVGALDRALRRGDTLYRIGGDEFVVLAPHTDASGAAAMLRRAAHAGAPPFSWGVAGLVGSGISPDDPQRLLAAADADLYTRRRHRRRTTGRAATRRRIAAAAAVSASVALVSSGAAALVASGGQGHGAAPDTSVPAAGPPSSDTGPFHWPVIGPVVLTPGPGRGGGQTTTTSPPSTVAGGLPGGSSGAASGAAVPARPVLALSAPPIPDPTVPATAHPGGTTPLAGVPATPTAGPPPLPPPPTTTLPFVPTTTTPASVTAVGDGAAGNDPDRDGDGHRWRGGHGRGDGGGGDDAGACGDR